MKRTNPAVSDGENPCWGAGGPTGREHLPVFAHAGDWMSLDPLWTASRMSDRNRRDWSVTSVRLIGRSGAGMGDLPSTHRWTIAVSSRWSTSLKYVGLLRHLFFPSLVQKRLIIAAGETAASPSC